LKDVAKIVEPVRPGNERRSSHSPTRYFVSSTVKELVAGSELGFADRGVHELKGVPGSDGSADSRELAG
jgi:hypothetical protein